MGFRSELAVVLIPFVVLAAAACGGSDAGSLTPGADIPTADRTPPPAARYEDHVLAGGIAPPVGTLENPFSEDRRSVTEGEGLFGSMNCAECHGGGAVGFVGPSLVDGRWRYGGGDGAVFQSIHSGRPRGMPAYGGILPEAAIWKIVTYLRSLPVPEGVPTASWR